MKASLKKNLCGSRQEKVKVSGNRNSNTGSRKHAVGPLFFRLPLQQRAGLKVTSSIPRMRSNPTARWDGG